ncbi:MAG: carbon-nitrogen hydrolase family protein [Paracoccaceae bacterium]|nr:carbon-nitrogen hydrolase family protein [Paracoccaceae bacterium]
MIIAVYQGPSPEGNIKNALARVNTTLAKAASKDVDMVVFPELFFPGYNQMQRHAAMAQEQGGSWETQFAELAKEHGCGLTIGWAERDDESIYNSASAFDRTGKKLAHYRKIQLWGTTERTTFEFGNHYSTFSLVGVKTGLLICYDVEFPQHVRALAQMGVQLILVPTANPEKFGHVCTTLVPARASENALTIAYANYCGNDNGLSFCGQSTIVGPDAQSLVSASPDEEKLLIADLTSINNINTALLSTQLADFRKVFTK